MSLSGADSSGSFPLKCLFVGYLTLRKAGMSRAGKVVGEVERQRRESLFDLPVAFTKVKLMVANCSLAKCSEEHINHKKQQSQVDRDLLQYVDEERERG